MAVLCRPREASNIPKIQAGPLTLYSPFSKRSLHFAATNTTYFLTSPQLDGRQGTAIPI